MNKRRFFTIILITLCSLSLFASENDGLTKEDLVKMAESSSPALRIERTKLAQSEADKKKALSSMLPKLDYSAVFGYQTNPYTMNMDNLKAAINGLGAYAFNGAAASYKQTIGNDFNPLQPPTDPAALAAWRQVYGLKQIAEADSSQFDVSLPHSYYSVGLTLTQPLVTWGKLYKKNTIYEALVDVQKNNLSLETKKLETEIRTRSEAYVYLSQLSASLSNAQKDADELADLVNSTLDEGMVTEADLYTALSTSAMITYANENAESQKEEQINQLGILTGAYNLKGSDLNITTLSKEEYAKILEDRNELSMVASAISSDKEAVKMLSKAVDIAEDMQYIANASIMAPNIALLANASYGGSVKSLEKDNFNGSTGSFNFTVGLTLQGTLFDGLGQWADKNKADAGVEKAKLEKEKTIQTLINTVKSTRRELKVTLANINYKETVLKEKQEALRVASDKYDTRQISRIDYLKASLEAVAAETEVYQEYIKASTLYHTLSMLI